MTEVVKQPAGALTVRPTQTDWTPQQLSALEALGIDKSVTAGDLQVFLTYAQRTGLDPFARQIYLLKRRQRVPGTKNDWETKWSIQCGIDGFRVIAQRSGKYRGQTPAEWCAEDGMWTDVWLRSDPPAAARAGVLHADYTAPLYAVATFSQYAALNRDGEPTAMWAKMPALMLHKCAEALALRRAFPNDLSGIYIAEEMDQAGRAIDPAPTAPPRSVDELADEATSADADGLRAIWREAAVHTQLDILVSDTITGEIVPLRQFLQTCATRLENPQPESSQDETPAAAADPDNPWNRAAPVTGDDGDDG